MGQLKDKLALITGGNSGIGLAIAERLASDGAQIVINGIVTQEEGERVCADLSSRRGVAAHYLQADLRDVTQIERLMRQSGEIAGGIDILVNNAGMQHTSGIEDFPDDIWNEMLAVNLSAAFHTIKRVLPQMKARDWGRIINVASISGLRGRAGKVAYNATKHGLIGLTKSVAIELAATGITCNAICPGWADTPLVQRQVQALATREGVDIATATRQLISLRQPSGRFVQLDQLAGMVSFLCSDEAQEVRGAAWTMDGGTTAL